MNIIYGKTLTTEDVQVVRQISLECGIMYDTAHLLYCRGINTVESAKRFLSPGKYGFHDPYLLSDMKSAVDRIKLALFKNQNVLIFGDYDADGICATAVLYFCLRDFGIKARTIIPEREDGYGINLEIIKKHHSEKKIDLLISVDCGISDFSVIEELKQEGIEVIVTDHHEPPEVLPDCIKINPKISGQKYPFCGLCGAGVAYKLGVALIGDIADKYLDFVSLATVADSMDLIDENRDIVVEGLKLFNSQKSHPSFKYLIGDNNKQITAQQTLAYNVAPRINAGGRMGDASSALKLFLSENDNEIFDLTAKLNAYNLSRQTECDRIYNEAKEKIRKSGCENNSIILVEDEQWGTGFIGIVAAKLVEDFCRPVIVFAGHNGFLKGSARSVDGVNVYEGICAVKNLLIGFGGHSQAAGISVSKENFAMLDKSLNEYFSNKISEVDAVHKICVEWNIQKPISLRFAKEIDMLEPFGVANKKPLFTTCIKSVKPMPLKIDSPHFSFKTDVVEMLNFNGENNVEILSLPTTKKVVFELNLSVYKNRESLKGYVRAVVPEYDDLTNLSLYAFENNLKVLLKDTNVRYLNFGKKEEISGGNGTVYVVSDPDTINSQNVSSNVPINIFNINGKNISNCIVLSPTVIPVGYKKVVYLDRPMQALSFQGESILNSDDIGYKNLDKVSLERSSFAKVFNVLKKLSGKSFISASDFYYEYVNDGDEYNFVFATTVFVELGLFKIINGVFTYDDKVQNPLTNSKVYSKICILKG